MNGVLIEELEARMLYSADATWLSDTDAGAFEQRTMPMDVQASTHVELVFLDESVPDHDTLAREILAQAGPDRRIEIVTLRGDMDGVAQISDALRDRHGLSAIHLISHGAAGAVRLGDAIVDGASMHRYESQIARWGEALAAGADILIYGCNVAHDAEGQAMLARISQIAGVDVAASDDLTGSAVHDGDWVLEYQVGEVGANTLGVGTWRGLLATLNVTTTDDVVDGNTSTIAALLSARGTDGAISLREALIAANNTAGKDVIVLGAGTYGLTRTGTGEDNALTGDLDVRDELTLAGAGTGATVIDAAGIDRVFHADHDSEVTFRDLTIRNGNAGPQDGGGIWLEDGANVQLQRVHLQGNSAKDGGAIANRDGSLSVTDSSLANNVASFRGGAVFNFRGDISIYGSTLNGNAAGATGGAIESQGALATLTVTNSTLSGNSAVGQGGAVLNQRTAAIVNSTIAFNSSGGAGGAVVNQGTAIALLRNTILADNINGNAFGTLISLGNNIDTDGSALLAGPGDISGLSAQLDATLQNNGGATATHALQVGSPAINNAGALATPVSDQRGFARVGAPDIGAYEAAAAIIVTPPTEILLSNSVVAENSALPLTVATLTATDADAFETFAYSVAGGLDAALFSIGGASNDRLLISAGALDYEAQASYVVRLAVLDSSGNRYEQTFTIRVTNVNEGPVNAMPGNVSIPAGSQAVFAASSALTVSDPDAGSAPIAVTLSMNSGTLSLSGSAGLSFTAGDGVDDTSMSFTGALSAINAAMDGLRFAPALGMLGSVVLTLTSDDLGNSGSGAGLTDTDSLVITITAVTVPSATTSSPLSMPMETPTAAAAQTTASSTQPAGKGDSGEARAPLDQAPTQGLRVETAVAETPSENAPGMPSMFRVKSPVSARGFAVVANAQAVLNVTHTQAEAPDLTQVELGISTPRALPIARMIENLAGTAWGDELRAVREQLARDAPLGSAVIATTVFVSGGISVGYVAWILRGGVLMSTLLSSLPAWQSVDPLPVLGRRLGKDDEPQADSIERLFNRARAFGSRARKFPRHDLSRKPA